MSLSDRIRPNSEAAPWVIKEVKELEAKLAASQAEVTQLNSLLRAVGWGQGEIDSAACVEEENEGLRKQLEDAQAFEAYVQRFGDYRKAFEASKGAVNQSP